jgi:hypothetical protein
MAFTVEDFEDMLRILEAKPAEGVEWYVRGGLSAGFLEFRRLPDGLDA